MRALLEINLRLSLIVGSCTLAYAVYNITELSRILNILGNHVNCYECHWLLLNVCLVLKNIKNNISARGLTNLKLCSLQCLTNGG